MDVEPARAQREVGAHARVVDLDRLGPVRQLERAVDDELLAFIRDAILVRVG